MKYIKQTDNWSCYGCAVAMAAGETLEDFIAFVGHDGSEIVEDSKHPDKRRGFYFREAAAYLLSKKIYMGFNCMIDPPISFHNLDSVQTTAKLSETKAILAVVSHRLPNCNHVIYWDGKRVYDPHDEAAEALKEYKVVEFWPICRIIDQPKENL